MKTKSYSKIDKIPTGLASDVITEGCLVLEGGAFRGLYGEGVLDAMMQNDINIRTVIGISAGALNGVGYVAGQIGYCARVNLTFRHDSRYIGIDAMRKHHTPVNVDFVFNEVNTTHPLDEDRFFGRKQRYIAAATNCLTGKLDYFEKGRTPDIFQAVKASSTMPYISPMVYINGTPYLDGGCSQKIPIRWALKNGFEKIVVVRTRDAAYRKNEKGSVMASRYHKHYPNLAKSLFNMNFEYNRECELIEQGHRDGSLFRIAPSVPVKVGRIEGDLEKLGSLYWLGYRDAMEALPALKKYLEIE